MTFDGAGGVTTLGCGEVSRVERVTFGDSAPASAPRVALMKLIEGFFKVRHDCDYAGFC